MKYIITIFILCNSMVQAANTFEVVDSGIVKSDGDIFPKMMSTFSLEKKKYVKVKIKDAGSERTILIEEKKSVPVVSASSSELKKESLKLDKLHSKVGVIVKFINDNIDIDTFVAKFSLKLKIKSVVGYYIFDNISTDSDIVVIQNILSDEMSSDIDTIRANWPMDVSIN